MRNIYVDIIEEIKNRLEAQCTETGLLKDFKHVSFVDMVQQAISNNNLPLIVLRINNAGEKIVANDGNNTPLASDISVDIHIISDLESKRDSNMYYNTTTKRGILYYYTYVLDAINTNLDGTKDCKLRGLLRQKMLARLDSITVTERTSEAIITLDMTSKEFGFSGRNY